MTSFSPAEEITKGQLATGLGIKPRSFTKELALIEHEILLIDPYYNKKCSRLKPKVAKFILAHEGVTLEEFRENYQENTHKKR